MALGKKWNTNGNDRVYQISYGGMWMVLRAMHSLAITFRNIAIQRSSSAGDPGQDTVLLMQDSGLNLEAEEYLDDNEWEEVEYWALDGYVKYICIINCFPGS